MCWFEDSKKKRNGKIFSAFGRIILANARLLIDRKTFICYTQDKNCYRGVQVDISYKKLWKLLIDKDMKKKDLQAAAGISSASVTKLAKNENVNTEVLQKVCTALSCDISDIMEMIPDNNQ